jgi:hypothetical protein
MTTEVQPRSGVIAGDPQPGPTRRSLRRPPVAGLVLLLAYVALSFLVDPRGSLGTDTGGKVATLEMMVQRGDLDPDVGYWAEPWDPDGDLHGLYYTARVGERFVNVTTLPMIYLTRPLYAVGGYRLALLVPMLGAVAAAFAARALARRIDGGDGWAAFWLIGLASPLVIYALDLWEHTLGVALVVWAVVVLVDAVGQPARWWRGVLSGGLIGVAASLRTEALVYGFVAVAVAMALLAGRRRVWPALVIGAGAAAATLAGLVANAGLERVVMGQTFRSDRTSGAATRGLSSIATRVDEAIITTGALQPSAARGLFLASIGLVGLLCYVAYRARDPRGVAAARVAAAVVGALYLWRVVEGGLGFVPGFVAATPFAAVGIVTAWRSPPARAAALMVTLALPLVWAFQFTGGAVPQWGGRYVLPTAIVLATVGVARVSTLPRWVGVYFLVLSVGVSALGAGWLSHRSHEVARAASEVQALPEPVVVSHVQFWLRELGAEYPGTRWLTAGDDEKLVRAVGVVERAGFDRFALIDLGDEEPREIDGYDAVAVQHPRWLDADFRITSYRRAP